MLMNVYECQWMSMNVQWMYNSNRNLLQKTIHIIIKFLVCSNDRFWFYKMDKLTSNELFDDTEIKTDSQKYFNSIWFFL